MQQQMQQQQEQQRQWQQESVAREEANQKRLEEAQQQAAQRSDENINYNRAAQSVSMRRDAPVANRSNLTGGAASQGSVGHNGLVNAKDKLSGEDMQNTNTEKWY